MGSHSFIIFICKTVCEKKEENISQIVENCCIYSEQYPLLNIALRDVFYYLAFYPLPEEVIARH